jgi:hypothetical protein
MPQTPILVPARLRRPPKTGWSWVDRRFLREHAAHLSRDAVLLGFQTAIFFMGFQTAIFFMGPGGLKLPCAVGAFSQRT